MNVALGALSQDRKVAVVFGCDEDCLWLCLIEHPNVVGIETDARGDLRLCFVNEFRTGVGDRHQFCLWLVGDVLQQSPDMIVIEADNGDPSFRGLCEGLSFEQECCEQRNRWYSDGTNRTSHMPDILMERSGHCPTRF